MAQPKVALKYRADLRLKVVECRTGNAVFLVPLEVFHHESQIDVYSIEERAGTAKLPLGIYSTIRKESLNG